MERETNGIQRLQRGRLRFSRGLAGILGLNHLHLLLPFGSSILYVIGVLFLKRAQHSGVCAARTAFVSNLVLCAAFMLLIPFGGQILPLEKFWQPGVLALLFSGGQACTFVALSKGDVSVATPVLGAKNIFVAWLTTLILGIPLPWQLWVAAGMSVAAIALIHRGSGGRSHSGRMAQTLVLSLLAALTFATFDVLVQKWSPIWGAGRLLPITFVISAVLSFGFMPFFREPLARLPWAAWRPLLLGGTLLASQSLIFITGMAWFGDAAAGNIVYSARGVWSVLLVWVAGHWLRTEEGQLAGSALRWRFFGAFLMTAAIVLIIQR